MRGHRERHQETLGSLQERLGGRIKGSHDVLERDAYMYFACLGPAIAFGGLAYKETAGQVGAMEYLCSQALSGILWAVFSGQPEIVLRPAGPQTVFLIELYKRCKS